MIKYLYKFKLEDFNDFAEEYNLDNWGIFTDTIKNRYKNMLYNEKLYLFKEMAKNNNIKHNKEEYISWMDNIHILYKALLKLEDYEQIYLKDLTICGELHMPLTNKRADIVIFKENKILIIEFSYSKTEDEEFRYNNKLSQVIQYKEILQNLLPKEIEIGTYTCLIHPLSESDKYIETINNLFLFLKNYFMLKKLNAYNQFIGMVEELYYEIPLENEE